MDTPPVERVVSGSRQDGGSALDLNADAMGQALDSTTS